MTDRNENDSGVIVDSATSGFLENELFFLFIGFVNIRVEVIADVY